MISNIPHLNVVQVVPSEPLSVISKENQRVSVHFVVRAVFSKFSRVESSVVHRDLDGRVLHFQDVCHDSSSHYGLIDSFRDHDQPDQDQRDHFSSVSHVPLPQVVLRFDA